MASRRSERAEDKPVFRIGTLNLRCDDPRDAANGWKARRLRVVDFLQSWQPDALGLQEPYRHQLDFLLEALPDYTYVGAGRDDGYHAGEFCPILFRKDRFAALEGRTFWLSESPETPGSLGWGCRYPRICTWARLAERNTYQNFYLFNTHLDNESAEARERGMALVAERIRQRMTPVPVVLMGDFNAPPESPALKMLTARDSPVPINALAAKAAADGPSGTFHGFTGEPDPQPIDHIFLSPEWTAVEGKILPDNGPPYLSDHFALSVVLRL